MLPSATVTLAQELIRRESVTPTDAGCQDLLCTRLQASGFTCERMNFHEVTNLWAVRGEAKPLLVFAGHTDVVPPGPLAQWENPPFAGIIADGMLHGRGAADMKSSIACFITACERFIKRYPQHDGTIGLLITSDEEGPARWGTQEVMRVLTERNCHIDMCIVGEPSSTAAVGDVIKVGRRGSLGARLRIKGKQEHIAYPTNNPLHEAVRVLAKLVEIEWDQGDKNFQPTSFQISNIHGGTGATNVIPCEVEIQFNLRYSPKITDQAIRETIEQRLAQHVHDFEIEWKPASQPFETVAGKLIEVVPNCIQAITGIKPMHLTTGGTSDGRFIAPTGAEVIELGLLNATIHQIDERVSTADIDVLSSIYENILQELLT